MKTLLFATIALLSLPAYALRIDNCDDKTHTVQVDYYGEVVEFTLEPGQRRYLSGRAREIILGDRSLYLIRPNDEYCIRNGKITLQRRKRNNKRVN